MKLIIKKIITFCIMINLNFTLYSQSGSKQELESERAILKEQIEEAKKQLDEIKKNKKSNLLDIALIQKRISLRNKKINLINQEINIIASKVNTHKNEISYMKQLISELKVQYKKSVVIAYKNNQSYNPTYFLFSSNSFSILVDRMNFLKKINQLRLNQLNKINISSNNLQSEINQLSKTQEAQSNILAEHKQEIIILKTEEDEKKTFFKQLKQNENRLAIIINKKKEQWIKIKKAINIVIEKEIALNTKKIKEEKEKIEKINKANKANKTKSKEVKKIKEEKENINNERGSSLVYNDKDFNLAEKFKFNKGKLSWPVQGTITMKFGKNRVADQSSITYDNSGITINANPNTPVKAIFNGHVTNIQMMDEGYLITIRHGQYWSIYIPIQNIKIKTGDEVKTGDIIGYTINYNPSELEFQILKDNIFQNPEHWLK